jgi:hypothetical protein
MILSISPGDLVDNCCLGRGGYLGIERAGTGRKGRKEELGERGWGVRCGGSSVQIS